MLYIENDCTLPMIWLIGLSITTNLHYMKYKSHKQEATIDESGRLCRGKVMITLRGFLTRFIDALLLAVLKLLFSRGHVILRRMLRPPSV